MRSSIAAAMAVTVLLASGCALERLSLRERVERSEWLRVNVQYVKMWTDRLSEYADQLLELQPEKPKLLPVDRLFYTMLNTTRIPSEAEAREAWVESVLPTTSGRRRKHVERAMAWFRQRWLPEAEALAQFRAHGLGV